MITEHDLEERGPEERGLQTRQDLPAPLAAMAEALRANAEALRRIDSSQRGIAETIAKADKASEVVASTRALNETFRGLSEIQRGLLDAVVKGRSGGGSPLMYLAVALLVSLLSVLIYDKWMEGRTVPAARFDEARAEVTMLQRDLDTLRGGAAAAVERDRAHKTELERHSRVLADSERATDAAEAQIRELERELESKKASLEQFVAVKAQADLAGALQVRNATLERETGELRRKVERLETERATSLEYFGEKLLDMRGADPAAIKEIAKKMDLYRDGPKTMPLPGGPSMMTRSSKRLLLNQLNALFPDAEEAYEALDVKAVDGGTRLLGITLARHKNSRLISSMSCKEMTILVDPDKDTVEIRLKDGFLTNTSRPTEKIPVPEGGHSIFLTKVGLKAWLRRFQGHVSVGEEGRLTFDSTPS